MGWRQLPDGTWYNTTSNLVSAPLQDPRGGGYPKRKPSPPAGVRGGPIRADAPAPEAQMIDGLAGNYGAIPGQWNLHMRGGRNYPALGASDGFLAIQPGFGSKILVLGALVGIATLTVWMQRRKKKKD